MEKAFREWLQRCHAELDKSLRFEDLAEPEAQAAARKKAGVTLFRRSHHDPSQDTFVGRLPLQMWRVMTACLPAVLPAPTRPDPCCDNGPHIAAFAAQKIMLDSAALQAGGGHGGGPDGGERRQHRQPGDEARPVRPNPAFWHRQGAAHLHCFNHNDAEDDLGHAHTPCVSTSRK